MEHTTDTMQVHPNELLPPKTTLLKRCLLTLGVIGFGVIAFFAMIFAVIFQVEGEIDTQVLAQVFNDTLLMWLQNLLYLLIIGVIYLIIKRYDTKPFFDGKKYQRKEFWTAVVVLSVCTMASLIIPSIILDVDTTENQRVLEQMVYGNLGVAFISIVIAAPIFEEIFFRRLIIGFVGNYSVTAAVISAVGFGSMHSTATISEQIVYLSGGLALSFLYLRYRSLKLNIIGHMVNNFISYIMILWVQIPLH